MNQMQAIGLAQYANLIGMDTVAQPTHFHAVMLYVQAVFLNKLCRRHYESNHQMRKGLQQIEHGDNFSTRWKDENYRH